MYYCGIDLGSKSSAVCIDDDKGRRISEFECPTDENSYLKWSTGRVQMHCIVEASPLAEWAAQTLEGLGHRVSIIDPRRAKAVICTKKKTDRLDARNLAKMARTGWYTEVHRKSSDARMVRTLLKARMGLLETAHAQQSRVLGLLRAHGIKGISTRGGDFEVRVLARIKERAPGLEPILAPLLKIWRQSRQEADALTKQLVEQSKADPICRLLMSVPGVGPIVSASFVAVIDDPGRFTDSSDVASYLGLVPRVHQSGATDYRGRITKEGDGLSRWLLVEAANALLTRCRRNCALREWGLQLREKKGLAKARVAVARKLAVLLHRIWTTGEPFVWATN